MCLIFGVPANLNFFNDVGVSKIEGSLSGDEDKNEQG